ncbi:MAG: hydantoinase/oxoprolinase family protein [Candidatus Margulisiibacteriota bacterium]
MPGYRIGIDVGGTFTHAVALDNSTYQLTGQVKVATTHSSVNGVAQGIIESLQTLISSCSIDPLSVVFIAHSTTQATNALLEGDVCPVGIIGIGSGVEGYRVKGETNVGDIDLGGGKKIKVFYEYVEKGDRRGDSRIAPTVAIKKLMGRGAGAIVVAEAFSVDDPAGEKEVIEAAGKMGIPATGTHEISGLYGLRIRTRTAVINASILPKMLETAKATNDCVKKSGIKAPLMIMRSDGGVMSIDEVSKRPILTILSGPAAGIASALLYVKISDGIFLEVGGTSTDIAVIKAGRAAVKSAQIGGHKLYLRTLDSRTVGIAGGSMPVISQGRMLDVGPRSAHIAGLKYASFSSPDEITADTLGSKIAVTTTCAANALGIVKEGEWAFGSRQAVKKALELLGLSAERLLTIACSKVVKVVEDLVKDYKLDKDSITLIGGGGGAAAIVPFTAGMMKLPHKIAENHAVLSAIGAALAMVCDTVEKNIVDPSKDDLLRVRSQARDSVIRMGASEASVEVTVEIDKQKNLVRACARGSIELRKRDLLKKELPFEERKKIAEASMKITSAEHGADNGWFEVFNGTIDEKTFFGLLSKKVQALRVVDREGVIRLSFGSAQAFEGRPLKELLEQYSSFGDGGQTVPGVYVLAGPRIIDLSNLASAAQMLDLYAIETQGLDPGDKVVIILVTE